MKINFNYTFFPYEINNDSYIHLIQCHDDKVGIYICNNITVNEVYRLIQIKLITPKERPILYRYILNKLSYSKRYASSLIQFFNLRFYDKKIFLQALDTHISSHNQFSGIHLYEKLLLENEISKEESLEIFDKLVRRCFFKSGYIYELIKHKLITKEDKYWNKVIGKCNESPKLAYYLFKDKIILPDEYPEIFKKTKSIKIV